MFENFNEKIYLRFYQLIEVNDKLNISIVFFLIGISSQYLINKKGRRNLFLLCKNYIYCILLLHLPIFKIKTSN